MRPTLRVARSVSLVVGPGLLLAACVGTSPLIDEPEPRADAGTHVERDAGHEVGPAENDAGSIIDAGQPLDAGDAADAGQPSDAGDATDAGQPTDAGTDTDAGATPDGGPEPLTATRAAAEMGRGFNLGRVFKSTLTTPRTFGAVKQKIDAYYAMGFRNVRIPVTWTEVVNGSRLVVDPLTGEVDRSNPRLALIAQVVDYALSLPGLYVVLNAHHEAGLKDGSRHAVLQRLWRDIADVFGDRSHRLLFEFLNEPHRSDGSAMPAADLRQMTGLAWAEVRARDPERIVIIGGNQWFGASEMAAVWKNLDDVGGGSDPYLMATFHHYTPWSFCGNDQGSYDDAWDADDQTTSMNRMATWANGVGQGMPVYIGEWGVAWGSRYSTMTCNNVRAWYTSFVTDSAAPRGQPTAVWDDGGWFKVFDYGAGAFSNNLADCIVGACAWDGSDRFNAGCL